MDTNLAYFAYGSNMSLARLRHRVAAAQPVGSAILLGYQLRFHKRGRDGSAKCNAFYTGGDSAVHGVLYLLPAAARQTLDQVEGAGAGYEASTVSVRSRNGQLTRALTYCATDIDDTLNPFCWYRHHVVTGAREFDLPPTYIARLENTPVVPDQVAARLAREYAPYLA